jgi:CRP-like cAMP-binding protein
MAAARSNSVIKVARLVRLTKLIRLARLFQVLRRLDDRLEGLLSSAKLVGVCLVVIYFAHLLGCLWFAVGTDECMLDGYNFDAYDRTDCPSHHIVRGWISRQDGWNRHGGPLCAEQDVHTMLGWDYSSLAFAPRELYGNVSTSCQACIAVEAIGPEAQGADFFRGDGWYMPCVGTHPFFKWTRAFYWAITTLTTVGFGDISANTRAEMFFSSISEIVGTMVFGALVGTVTTIVSRKEILSSRHEVEQTEIKEFMKAKKIPAATQLKVKTYLSTLFKAKRCFDEERVMKNLPPKLMYEVLDCLHRRQVMHVPVFKRLPEEITEAIYYALLPQPVAPDEVIYRRGDVARECFILIHGSVLVSKQMQVEVEEGAGAGPTTPRGQLINTELQAGAFFGERALDFKMLEVVIRDDTAKAITHSELSLLKASDLESLARQYPILETRIRQFAARNQLRARGTVLRKLASAAVTAASGLGGGADSPERTAQTSGGLGGGEAAPERSGGVVIADPADPVRVEPSAAADGGAAATAAAAAAAQEAVGTAEVTEAELDAWNEEAEEEQGTTPGGGAPLVARPAAGAALRRLQSQQDALAHELDEIRRTQRKMAVGMDRVLVSLGCTPMEEAAAMDAAAAGPQSQSKLRRGSSMLNGSSLMVGSAPRPRAATLPGTAEP